LRELKKRRRRDRIYEAALELLAERGFSHTHMKEIAERAELAVGTLYNYYDSKHELYMEIMEAKWAQIIRARRREVIRSLYREEDLLSILEKIFFPILEDMLAMGLDAWSEVFMATFSTRSLMERGASMDREAIVILSALLAKLQRRGRISASVDIEAAAYSFYSVVAMNFLGLLFMEEFSQETFFTGLERQLSLVIDGIAPGRGGRDPQEERSYEENSPTAAGYHDTLRRRGGWAEQVGETEY